MLICCCYSFCFFFYSSAYPRDLHSFPTRRSSDLGGTALLRCLPALEKLKLHDDEAIGVNIVKRALEEPLRQIAVDRKSTRLNSSHLGISYAVFCLKKKKNNL